MEAKVYNSEGKVSGSVTLPENIFSLPWNGDLVNQVIYSMRSSARSGTAHTKDRSEVSGGGKKPWKQKGTGRARHGSIRSPLWVGGGVTHGPRKEKDYFRKVNKKMKNKALFTVLSAKLKDGEIIFVDDLGISEVKTKKAQNFLSKLAANKGFRPIVSKNGNKVLVSTTSATKEVVKSFANIKQAKTEEVRNLNPLDVLSYRFLIISRPEESLKVLSDRLK